MVISINSVFALSATLLLMVSSTGQSPTSFLSTSSSLNQKDSSGEEKSKLCGDMQYENRNTFEVETLSIRKIKGVARDRNGRPIPQVCIAVFGERDHQFIAATKTDDQGNFELKGIPAGSYRLVGKLDPFLTANARIELMPNASRKKLLLVLVLNEIDACSGFELR